jgi:hypothetical protein
MEKEASRRHARSRAGRAWERRWPLAFGPLRSTACPETGENDQKADRRNPAPQAKSLNSRNPPEIAGRNHNPRVGGSSPSSGITSGAKSTASGPLQRGWVSTKCQLPGDDRSGVDNFPMSPFGPAVGSKRTRPRSAPIPVVGNNQLHTAELSPGARRLYHHRAVEAAKREFAPVLHADREALAIPKEEYRNEAEADRGAMSTVAAELPEWRRKKQTR